MTNMILRSAVNDNVENLHTFLMDSLTKMEDGFNLPYFENMVMTVEMNNGETWKVVPTWWSPAGFTGYDYGKAEDMDAADESLLDADDFVTSAQMAGILEQAIISRNGFMLIEITADVDDEEA